MGSFGVAPVPGAGSESISLLVLSTRVPVSIIRKVQHDFDLLELVARKVKALVSKHAIEI